MKKVIIFIMLVMISLTLTACSVSPDKYTEEEHIGRIAEKVEKRFMTDDYEYTSFKTYPVYDENDKFSYVLVEFEPQYFVFVTITDATWPWGHSMYLINIGDYWKDDSPSNETWSKQRYVWLKEGQRAEDVEYDCWVAEGQYAAGHTLVYDSEKNEWITEYHTDNYKITLYEYKDGEKVVYRDSPYKVAGVLDKKLYYIAGHIPAVKTENGYLNLVSMQEFAYDENFDRDSQPQIPLRGIPKSYFNL